MAAPRVVRSDEEIRAAWEAAQGRSQFCRKLAIGYNPVAAARLCAQAGLDYPAPHWGYRSLPQPKLPDPAEQVARDTELQRAKDERDRLRAQYRASLREANLHRELLELAREAWQPYAPAPVVAPKVAKSTLREDAILSWADWHGGEVVDYDVMQGYNAYDPAIMCRRAQYTVDTTLELLFARHVGTTFERLWVFDLGDSINGDLLDEAKATNAVPVNESMRLVAHVRARALTELAAYLPVTYIAVPGNHARRSPKMQWKLPTETGDWLIAEMVGDLCRENERIQCVSPKSWSVNVEIRDHVHALNHGTTMAKGGFGGISWYSIQRSDGKLTALESARGRHVNFRWLGHIHQRAEIPAMDGEGELFVVGSLKGGDEYALYGLQSYSGPRQQLVGCHEKTGVSWRYPLFVQFGDERPSRYEDLLS